MSENKNKYDVGITGYWWSTNYGSVATYYALYRLISDMGMKAVLIDRPESSVSGEGTDVFSRKFMNEHAEVSESLGWGEYGAFNDICDTFIIGSDQVWTSTSIKSYKYFFFLDFANDDKNKIAYAASFGERFNVGDDEKKIAGQYLKRFSGVSVREIQAVDICRNELDIDAEWVMDPVFLLSMKHWKNLAANAPRKTADILGKECKYLFAYILDPSEEKREIINETAKRFGLPVICILDGRKGTFEEKNKILHMPNTVKDAVEEEWIYFLSNAEYVVTDSQHGSALSIVFNKQFICCSNKKWGQARYESLFGLLGLKNRQNRTREEIQTYDTYNQKIDYDKVNAILKEKVISSRRWLANKLNINDVKATVDSEACIGCSACACSCPVDAIVLKPDEYGYYIREVDRDKCIGCGICSKLCPAINPPQKDNSASPDLFEYVASGEDVLTKSSSGGVFTALSDEALRRNGAVVGSVWSDDFTAKHIIAENTKEVAKQKKSKYFQSYLGTIFKDIKTRLEKGQFVLFTGTPCQVAGLKAFLNRDYDNLLLVDILCGNAPSAMFFRKYIDSSYPDGIKRYEFRHKSDKIGWNCHTVEIETSDGQVHVCHKEDDFQRVFHNHTMCPLHCEKCQYQAVPRYGDITIGDFWGISKRNRPYDTSRGVSAVLLNNSKGKAFFLSLPEQSAKINNQVPLDWLGRNGWAINGSKNHASPDRDRFYEAITKMTFHEAVSYALKSDKPADDLPSLEQKPAIMYNVSFNHFRFDPNIWSENISQNSVELKVKIDKPGPGKYAVLPLIYELKCRKKYRLNLKFKYQTDHSTISFNVKNSESSKYQAVKHIKLNKNMANKWQTISEVFTVNSDFYDEFMIGASQLYGKDNYIAFEYIYITEE